MWTTESEASSKTMTCRLGHEGKVTYAIYIIRPPFKYIIILLCLYTVAM